MPTPLDVCLLIDLDDKDEVRKLATDIGASEEAVIEAAKIVGRMPKAIQFYLMIKSRQRKQIIRADVRAQYDLIKQGVATTDKT